MDSGTPGPGAGRAPRVRGRACGARRANLAGAFGQVWATFGAPGSVLLTLFLKEWLHAEKWQIGLVMTMTFLGPCFEPPGAWLAERLGRRRPLFLATHLFNRLIFFALALLPLLGSSKEHRSFGIGVVFAVVGCSRVIAHLGAPAWWSWMADLVPERRRSRFFSCRTQAAGVMTALSFIVGMALLQTCGGMTNPVLISSLFCLGAVFGTFDILLYFRVPEPPLLQSAPTLGIKDFVGTFCRPYQDPTFRRLLCGMGLWSFSANLVMPFLPVYQRGELVGDELIGLGVSWFFLAVLNVTGSTAGFLTCRRWCALSERHGPRFLMVIGSGYLFVNLAYLLVHPEGMLGALVPVALVSGALNAAWTVGTHQLLLKVAPREKRSFFISAYNFTNGWMMAAGPLLGGLLADSLPILSVQLPSGMWCCYFHVLLVFAFVGGLGALTLLRGVPVAAPRGAPEPTLVPRVIAVRFRLVRRAWRRKAQVLDKLPGAANIAAGILGGQRDG